VPVTGPIETVFTNGNESLAMIISEAGALLAEVGKFRGDISTPFTFEQLVIDDGY
jgi:hypothetical protein